MKIYILPVPQEAQPPPRTHPYPVHNQDDYGVEQDFWSWSRPGKIDYTKDVVQDTFLFTVYPNKADWHYLPIFWTRWYLNHTGGARDSDQLDVIIDNAVIDGKKTFTICQYFNGLMNGGDIGILPFYPLRRDETGIDIPLLCTGHRIPIPYPEHKYLASFVGRQNTHAIRDELAEEVKCRKDIYFEHVKLNDAAEWSYVNKCLESYCVLAPRGWGGNSFRFYEAMELMRVPMLISDIDTRPFKKYIDWDSCSFYAKTPKEAIAILDSTAIHTFHQMARCASDIYHSELRFGKWCKYVIRELEDVKAAN